MAAPFFSQCPHCTAELRINNPEAAGRKVRCPNCHDVFVAEPSRSEGGDFAYEDDPDEGFYDDEYAPRRSSREHRRSSPRRDVWILLFAVVAGIVLLASTGGMFLLHPALDQARTASQRSQDKNNLKQVGIAMHNFHDAHDAFPIVREENHPQGRPLFGPPANTNRQLSWRVHLLPYLEQQPLYEQFHLDEPWDSEHNRKLIPLMPEVYKRPGSNLPEGTTTYLGIDGPGGVMEDGGGTRIRDLTDGASNTILVVEVADEHAVIWTKPEDYRYDPQNPVRDLGGWEGGFHALLCDGSVRFISKTIHPQTLLFLFQRNDNQVIGEF